MLVTYTARAKKWTKKKRKTIGSPIITDPQTHYEAMNRLNVQRSQATAKAIKDGQAMQKVRRNNAIWGSWRWIMGWITG